MRRGFAYFRQHTQIGAYLLVVIATAIGFQAVRNEQRVRTRAFAAEAKEREESIRRSQEQATKERVEQICTAINKEGDALHKMINRMGSSKAPPGSSPDLVRAYEQSAREAEVFRRDANKDLAAARCVPEEILKSKE